MTVTATIPANATLFDTTGGTSGSTGSWTGAGAERSYAAFVLGVAGGGSDLPTVSGNGITWGQDQTVEWDSIASPVRRLTSFTGRGTATTGATTASFGAESQAGIGLVVVELDTDATNDGVVQSATGRADNGTAESVTLAAFASATNGVLACFCTDTNVAATIETGFTPLFSSTFTGPNTGIVVGFLASADTSPSATGNNVAWAGIALEYAEAVEAANATLFIPWLQEAF